MPGKSMLSEDQWAILAPMREEEGQTLRVIALRVERLWGLKVSQGVLGWGFLVRGIDLPPEKRCKAKAQPKVMQRGEHVIRQYSPEEDERLKQLDAQGKPYAEIGRLIGRKPNSVRGRLATLARHEARQEAAE